VAPQLRVASTGIDHFYSDSLYAPLADRIRVERMPRAAAVGGAALQEFAGRIDLLHMHWPEWLMIGGVARHRRLIEGLRDFGIGIVWTQHDLVPHSKDPRMVPVYQAWAEAADLVIHHSQWGREKVLTTYHYGAHTRHVVIAHGHSGRRPDADERPRIRSEVESELGLRSGTIRLGIFGAPRPERDTARALRAVARSHRQDVEVVVFSLSRGQQSPTDPRIAALPHEWVPRETYDRRLAAVDALLMPIDPDGDMLTTGTAGDALGFGLPTVASSWPYLAEVLGDAAIVYGQSEDDLVACLDGLDREDLSRAGTAALSRRDSSDWEVIAEQTYRELVELSGRA